MNTITAYAMGGLLKRFLLYALVAIGLVSFIESMMQFGVMPIRFTALECLMLWLVTMLQIAALLWPGLWLAALLSTWNRLVRSGEWLIWQGLGLSPTRLWRVIVLHGLGSATVLAWVSFWLAPWAFQFQAHTFYQAVAKSNFQAHQGVFQKLRLGPDRSAVYYFPSKTQRQHPNDRFFLHMATNEKDLQLWSRQGAFQKDAHGASLKVTDGVASVFEKQALQFQARYKEGFLPFDLPKGTWFKGALAGQTLPELMLSPEQHARHEALWRMHVVASVVTATCIAYALLATCTSSRPLVPMLAVGVVYAGLLFAMMLLKSLGPIPYSWLYGIACHALGIVVAYLARRMLAMSGRADYF